jgi:type IV secretory pathway VirB4 component
VHRESILKMFQQDDTLCTVFYSLQAALHVSGETFTHHQELKQTAVTASSSDKQHVTVRRRG